MPYNRIEATVDAENDHKRSVYIKTLVQSSAVSVPRRARARNIPRTIIQYWDDLQKIPEDVRECINSWEQLSNEGFEHRLFDDEKARDFISNHFSSRYLITFDRCYHPAMRCDYFRICYLYIEGGFYVDADEIYQGKPIDHLFENNRLKLQPLCYEISSGAMIEPERFLNKKESAVDWIFYFNNNPIVSPPKHPILKLALKRATTLLNNSETRLEIQSTTGPGNLSASVVKYHTSKESTDPRQPLYIFGDWTSFSITPWPLSYRNDARNWRIGAKPGIHFKDGNQELTSKGK